MADITPVGPTGPTPQTGRGSKENNAALLQEATRTIARSLSALTYTNATDPALLGTLSQAIQQAATLAKQFIKGG